MANRQYSKTPGVGSSSSPVSTSLSRVSPADILRFEIISYIFLLRCEAFSEPSKHYACLARLMSVSSFWRAVVIKTPMLWATIEYPCRHTLRQLILERCGDSRLIATICDDSVSQVPGAFEQQLFPDLVNDFKRFSRARMNIRSSSLSTLAKVPRDIFSSSLTSLSLDCPESGTSIDLPALVCKLPSLTSINLNCEAQRRRGFVGPEEWAAYSIWTIIDAVRAAPNLQAFGFTDGLTTITHIRPAATEVFPPIQSLTLVVNILAAQILLEYIDLPALEDFHLVFRQTLFPSPGDLKPWDASEMVYRSLKTLMDRPGSQWDLVVIEDRIEFRDLGSTTSERFIRLDWLSLWEWDPKKGGTKGLLELVSSCTLWTVKNADNRYFLGPAKACGLTADITFEYSTP